MDKKICQIVDSSGCLPREIIKQYQISEVPFYFTFNQENYYRENVSCESNDFYQHMVEYPEEVPKTAAPNIEDWLATFEERYAGGAREFIVTTISSLLSSSYQNALAAKKIFKERHNDIRMRVVSSNTCACGQAALEIGIAKMLDSNKDYKDLIEVIHKMVSRISTLFVVNSLKYMKAGGRIGGATAFLGKLINIKPLCEFIDGTVHPIKAIRGRNNSLKAMVEATLARISDLNKTIIIIQNAQCQEDANFIVNYIKDKVNYTGKIFNSSLGIIVGAHSGPGTIGIGFLEYPDLFADN
jgi:DegV family protein with EDD domain